MKRGLVMIFLHRDTISTGTAVRGAGRQGQKPVQTWPDETGPEDKPAFPREGSNGETRKLWVRVRGWWIF